MTRRRITIAVVVLLLAGLLAAAWWLVPAGPMPEAEAALRSTAAVQVASGEYIAFMPAGEARGAGLIFYPGGKVDPRAYAPQALAIATDGFPVVVVPMPLNLAFFAPERAAGVIAAYPQVKAWAIGGHSLGGVAAAQFAARHPGAVKGVVFWASYPADSSLLSRGDLRILSVFGTRDGLASAAKIDASRPLLPAATHWVAVEGGNHAQFGWYGAQSGDNPAAISRAEQQKQVVAATVALLAEIETAR